MALFSTSISAPARSGLAAVFTNPIHRAAEQISAWNDMRTNRKLFSALSDRELNDIGLVRGDIENFR